MAVPVARALGYSLGRAYQGQLEGSDPLFVLPESFSNVKRTEQLVRASSVGTIPAGEVVEH